MTTPDYARLIESLDHRASTMNGAEPVGAGEGHTYVTGYYTVLDRMLDREAATALSTLLESNAALERERDELKHDVSRYVEIASDEATRADAAEAKLAEAMKVIGDLLACPSIADEDHSDPEWGCEETADAERAAREFLKENGNGE